MFVHTSTNVPVACRFGSIITELCALSSEYKKGRERLQTDDRPQIFISFAVFAGGHNGEEAGIQIEHPVLVYFNACSRVVVYPQKHQFQLDKLISVCRLSIGAQPGHKILFAD